MLKYFFIPLLSITSYFSTVESAPAETLVFDMRNEESLPPRFRKSSDVISDPTVNKEGLSNLRVSGSGQFSELSLEAIRKKLGNPTNLVVLDLRDESHGFINGAAVTWYADRDWGNKDLNNEDAAAEEKKRLASVLVGSTITIYTILEKTPEGAIFRKANEEVKVKSVKNEETVTKEQNVGYKRLRVLDHTAPELAEVEAFENFVKQLPQDAWLHVHCRAGSGRTTTFLVLYDIIKNGKNVPLNEILRRQYLLGGGDLVGSAESDGWKGPYAQERLIFLQNFYNRTVNKPN